MSLRCIILSSAFFASISGQAFAGHAIIGGGDRCTITAPNFDITIGNIAKAPQLNTLISFSCRGYYPIQPGNQVTYCWHIHGQATGGNNSLRSTLAGPTAAPPAGQTRKVINFRLYALDAGVRGAVVPVGSTGGARYNITGIADSLSGDPSQMNKYSVNWANSVGLRFEENQAPEGYAPGDYIYSGGTLHGTMWQNTIGDPITYLNTCGNATGGDIGGDPNYYQAIKFSIHVKSYCNLAVKQDLDFGKVPMITADLHTAGIINVDCSAGTDFKVTIDNGRNYADGQRHMANAQDSAAQISYSIDKEEWTGTGTGTPQGIDLDINGTVPVQPTPKAGAYKDVLVVSLTKLSL